MMKRTAAIAIFLAVGMSPALALAAEHAENGATSWFALLFYVVNAAIFVWLCAHFGGPLVRKYFADRASTIRQTLDRFRNALAEAETLANHARQRIAELAAEKTKLAADLEAETVFQVKQLREAGANAAARIRRDAELTVHAATENARRRLRARLATVAATLAGELVRRSITDEDQGRLLESFGARLSREARG